MEIPSKLKWSDVRFHFNSEFNIHQFFEEIGEVTGNEFSPEDHRYFGGIMLILPKKKKN